MTVTLAQTSIEATFAEVLADLVGVDPVPVDGHFFDDLGADSMVMARFCARVRKHGDLLGYSPLEVGLAFLPACLVIGWLSLGYAEKLIMGIGPRAALLGGLVAFGASLALFSTAPVDGDYWTDVFAVMVLLGAGAGLAFPALMTLAMSGATDEDSGLASGLINTTMQVGGALGLAVLATLASQHSDALRADGEPLNSALNSGYQLAYLVGAGCIAAAILAALLVLKPASPTEAVEGEPVLDAEPAYSEAG